MANKLKSQNNGLIEEIVQSWDGAEKAQQPDPFFYNKVMGQIITAEKPSVWYSLAYYFSKPVIAFVFGFLFLTVNISIVWKSSTDHSMTNMSLETERDNSATDAGFIIQSFYDINNY